MFLGPQGLIILIIAMVAGLLTQSFVNSAYRKNSRIPLPAGLTGAAVAPEGPRRPRVSERRLPSR